MGTPDLGDEFREPVESDVPTLFVSGTLDAKTPPHQAERVREGFTNSVHLLVENGGHDSILSNPEVFRRMLDFLRGLEVNTEVIVEPSVRFIPLEGTREGVTQPSVADAGR